MLLSRPVLLGPERSFGHDNIFAMRIRNAIAPRETESQLESAAPVLLAASGVPSLSMADESRHVRFARGTKTSDSACVVELALEAPDWSGVQRLATFLMFFTAIAPGLAAPSTLTFVSLGLLLLAALVFVYQKELRERSVRIGTDGVSVRLGPRRTRFFPFPRIVRAEHDGHLLVLVVKTPTGEERVVLGKHATAPHMARHPRSFGHGDSLAEWIHNARDLALARAREGSSPVASGTYRDAGEQASTWVEVADPMTEVDRRVAAAGRVRVDASTKSRLREVAAESASPALVEAITDRLEMFTEAG